MQERVVDLFLKGKIKLLNSICFILSLILLVHVGLLEATVSVALILWRSMEKKFSDEPTHDDVITHSGINQKYGWENNSTNATKIRKEIKECVGHSLVHQIVRSRKEIRRK